MPRCPADKGQVSGLQGVSSDSDDSDDEAEYSDKEVFALQGVSSDSDDDDDADSRVPIRRARERWHAN
jgi:hypothetical protein